MEEIKNDNTKKEVKKKKAQVGNTLFGILKGNLFSYDFVLVYLPFVFFLGGLSMVYIANNYYAVKTIMKIAKEKKELKELRYEFITSSSSLMQMISQSAIAGRMEIKSKGLKESTTPPFKIYK